jgi:uncharacterized membrane protein
MSLYIWAGIILLGLLFVSRILFNWRKRNSEEEQTKRNAEDEATKRKRIEERTKRQENRRSRWSRK